MSAVDGNRSQRVSLIEDLAGNVHVGWWDGNPRDETHVPSLRYAKFDANGAPLIAERPLITPSASAGSGNLVEFAVDRHDHIHLVYEGSTVPPVTESTMI